MAKLSTNEIRDMARSIIAEAPGGVRYSDLVRKISASSPETPANTIHSMVWNLHRKFPKEIAKPSRGVFVPTSALVGAGPVAVSGTVVEATRLAEEQFYHPFAEWLEKDLDEVTVATVLGGAAMGKKWATPDVVGVYKPRASDLIKFPLEIVSVEIKIDPQQPVVAFGQAISYRLFSSKTYIAMPNNINPDDQSRLEALCILFGVGMVLFDLDPAQPNFAIRVRAQKFAPDMFYVNEFAERLNEVDAEQFEKLFR